MRVIAACYQTAGEPAKDKPARTSRAQDLAFGPDNAGMADVDQVERGALTIGCHLGGGLRVETIEPPRETCEVPCRTQGRGPSTSECGTE
jgi:hypothetical protein